MKLRRVRPAIMRILEKHEEPTDEGVIDERTKAMETSKFQNLDQNALSILS